ncbi:MAG: imidazole glycerol phosphate synthase subunit HisH, partial [Rickettsiales bacterium]|nr:imidazole glycerol phosphate synthase subunit HisH [Rickettsiales bacterium]
MTVVLIDYGSGNLHSAAKALEREAAPQGLDVVVTADPAVVCVASHVVLPGVGAFGDCVRGLSAIAGMREALEGVVRQKKRPFLGICVGMQMLAERGLEHGEHAGLGWIPGEVVPITPEDPSLKIPHMGWNALEIRKEHPLFAGIESEAHAYFVHSFHMRCTQAENVLAMVDYGGAVTAAVAQENIMGVQFHPEKS